VPAAQHLPLQAARKGIKWEKNAAAECYGSEEYFSEAKECRAIEMLMLTRL